MQFNSLVERMITWKHIRNFGENTEGLPCIDTQRRAALELLVIKTPHGLSCTTGCHTSSCSPCDTVWGQSQGRISQHGLHLCDRQSSAPRSPCRAAQSPCSAPTASPSASAILCISHLQYTRDGQGTCAMTTDKTLQQTSEKPSSPHSTPSFFSATKSASISTRMLFSPKEGHGAKVSYQRQSNRFITWALFKSPKSPAEKLNSFWDEISAPVENCWASFCSCISSTGKGHN